MAHALGGLARSSHTYWADTLALPESMCKVSTGSDDCSSSQSRSAVHGVGSGFARARGSARAHGARSARGHLFVVVAGGRGRPVVDHAGRAEMGAGGVNVVMTSASAQCLKATAPSLVISNCWRATFSSAEGLASARARATSPANVSVNTACSPRWSRCNSHGRSLRSATTSPPRPAPAYRWSRSPWRCTCCAARARPRRSASQPSGAAAWPTARPDETMTAVNPASPTMNGESLWPRLAGLPLVIEACEYDRLHAVLAYEFE